MNSSENPLSRGNAALFVGVASETEAKLRETAPKDLFFMRVPHEPQAVARALASETPTVAIVALEPKLREEGLAAIAQAARAGAQVLVIGSEKEPEQILAAMRAGAREFVLPGEEPRLAEALRRVALGGAQRGHIVAVFPTKGGVGATATTIHLGGALGTGGRRVCLVDLDFEFGALQAALNLERCGTLSELLDGGRADGKDGREVTITQHASGVHVIGQSARIEDGESLSSDRLAAALDALRGRFDWVLVDGLRGFSDRSLCALDHADAFLLMVSQEILSVRAAQRALELFRRLGYPDDKVKVILSRWQGSHTITRELIEESLGRPLLATIAHDPTAAAATLERAAPASVCAKGSALAMQHEALARALDPTGAGVVPVKRSALARLFSRGVR